MCDNQTSGLALVKPWLGRPSLAMLSLVTRTVLDSQLMVVNPHWKEVPEVS